MTHFPAAEDFAVLAFGGIGPVVPGVAPVETLLAQVMGVRRGFAFVVEQRVVGEDPVVAKVRFEADLVERLGLRAVGVDRQTLQGIDMNGNEVKTWPQEGFPSAIIDPKLVGGERGHVLLQLSAKEPGKLGSAGNGLGNQSVGELDWNGTVVWQWGDKAPGGAAQQHHDQRRLPNGNTLIDEGMNGRFFQVTASGENVWEYVSPYLGKAPGSDAISNWVYRALPVSYDWVPLGTPRSETAVIAPAIGVQQASASR